MNKIRLTYRAFARETRAVEDQWEQVYKKLGDVALNCLSLDPDRKYTQTGPGTMYWPVDESTAHRFRNSGILLAEDEGVTVALVREWTVTIELTPEDNQDKWLRAIQEQVGPVFTNVELITEIFTDVGPQ